MSPSKLEIRPFSTYELATDHGFLNWGTISKFDWVGFLIFGLVFVSYYFEVGTNVSTSLAKCRPSVPVWG